MEGKYQALSQTPLHGATFAHSRRMSFRRMLTWHSLRTTLKDGGLIEHRSMVQSVKETTGKKTLVALV